jgi:outer membrane cobalamin receptor
MRQIGVIIKKSFTLLSLVLLVFCVTAQDDLNSIYDLSMGELSKLKVTSATKTAQYSYEIQSTVRVIEKSVIEERGYFTLDELLSDLPGFQFRNIMSLNSYSFQRGIPNQNNLTLVLIDGVQVNELNSGGFYGGGQYNLSNIERVEVVYGPSSVAYGTNAVSGIINIITSKAEKNESTIHALAGGFNTYLSDVTFNRFNTEKGIGFRVSGMVKSTEKADLKGAAGDYNWTDLMDNYENDYSIDLKATYKGFTFGTNYLQKQSATVTMQPSVATAYRDAGTFWNILFLNNYLKHDKTLSPKLTLSSILYNRNATVLKNSIYTVLDTTQVGYFRPNNLTGFESILNFKARKNLSLIGGVLFEYEKLANSQSLSYSSSAEIRPPVPDKPSMHTNFLASLFFEPSMVFFGRLYLSGGIRFDESTVYQHVLTPRAGIRYNFSTHSLRFNYAEAFRAPKPWDYSDGLGNTSLKPENMRSFETSLTIMASKRIKIEMNAYRNKLHNGIMKETSNYGYRWINSSEIVTLGSEISLQYNGEKVAASLNYTFTDSRDDTGIRIAEISNHVANGCITYTFSKRLKLNARVNYVGERENPAIIKTTGNNLVGDYLLLNGTVCWMPVEKMELRFIVKNLFNAEYYHTSNRSPNRYRQPQRLMMLSVAYLFNEN